MMLVEMACVEISDTGILGRESTYVQYARLSLVTPLTPVDFWKTSLSFYGALGCNEIIKFCSVFSVFTFKKDFNPGNFSLAR